MIENQKIDIPGLFRIFDKELAKNIGYGTIYEVLGDRKEFSLKETNIIINDIRSLHREKENKRKIAQTLSFFLIN